MVYCRDKVYNTQCANLFLRIIEEKYQNTLQANDPTYNLGRKLDVIFPVYDRTQKRMTKCYKIIKLAREQGREDLVKKYSAYLDKFKKILKRLQPNEEIEEQEACAD